MAFGMDGFVKNIATKTNSRGFKIYQFYLVFFFYIYL